MRKPGKRRVFKSELILYHRLTDSVHVLICLGAPAGPSPGVPGEEARPLRPVFWVLLFAYTDRFAESSGHTGRGRA